jgi:glycosyltransferase involved in cell wall biosynthesis
MKLPNKNARICVGIISYRAPNDVRVCIQSVLENTTLPVSIIVQDNTEDESNAKMVRKEFPGVLVSSNGINEGCSRGRNAMWEMIKKELPRTKYFVTLDQDMYVKKGWLADMMQAMGGNTKIGIVSWPQFTKQDVQRNGEVLAAGAGATLYRMRTLDDTKGWEPGFLMYRFDTWICLLAKKFGWKTHVVTKYIETQKKGYNASDVGVMHRHPHKGIVRCSTWQEEQVKSHHLFKKLINKHKLSAYDRTPLWPWSAKRLGPDHWEVRRGKKHIEINNGKIIGTNIR